ncbi:hypothetical protein E2O24_05025 [Campylobacter volucris]|uniref:hypothetical protein n=1 Tax=Campylobacter volucris TaxID=1031542 RepID=UPI001059306E|nr:hypothetical protein [Campylobacter volucris]TDJ86735.1 hypothetical protein E2O24_05025 [Campylobacter volucris]
MGWVFKFLEFDKVIFVPTYGIDEDERVLSFLQNIYKDKQIIDVYLKTIIKKKVAPCIALVLISFIEGRKK